jgi:mannitol-1-phosphate 5-dehydrogenase
MRAVIYGAGNIGRGFIAQLFAESGYEVTFIDVAEPLIETINTLGRYPIRFISNESRRDVWVEKVRAVNGNDPEKPIEAIAGADIMATAVGVRILPFIAPVIAEGIRKRFERSAEYLNIIICENLIEADKLLEKLIKEKLNSKEICLFDERIGLVEASIGRMVPIQTAQMLDGNPLRICSEEYGFLPVNKNAFKGEIPRIKGMEAFDNFGFFIKRKLFIHNMGHALCAYLGMYVGDTFIHEAVNREEIHSILQNAMLESALALSKKFKVPLEELSDHIQDLIQRFSNRALGDTCIRVGLDTGRKLGGQDRFIGAIRCCEKEGVQPVFISVGTAAALYQNLKENNSPQTRETAAKTLSVLSGLSEGAAGLEPVLTAYSLMAAGKPLSEILSFNVRVFS